MKLKNPQGSILIVTMFLLIVTGLIAVIVMVYIRSMLAFTNAFHDYQQAFYFANAGLELQLVKAKNHGFGYEDSVIKDSQTITKNFSCIKSNCGFTSSLKTKSYVTSQTEQISTKAISCIGLGYTTDTNKLISSLFLFEDASNSQNDSDIEGELINSKGLRAIKNTNIKIYIDGLSSYRLALQAGDGSGGASDFDKIITLSDPEVNLASYQVDFFNEIPESSQIRIKIINDLKKPGKVCFSSFDGNFTIPGFHQMITSVGSFAKTSVRLQAIQTNIPGDEQDLAGGSV